MVDSITVDLWHLVDSRRSKLGRFLKWAAEHERPNTNDSLRAAAREDVKDALEALRLFPEDWWGLVVFSCFGSPNGTKQVAPSFQRALPVAEANRVLEELQLSSGSLGHHRKRPGFKGAKAALASACQHSEQFKCILHCGLSFHVRFENLRAMPATQWGRTTCFDLLLRAGLLGVGGQHYSPDRAYLLGSTGPKAGFKAIWGKEVTPKSAEWCEQLLGQWTHYWDETAQLVDIRWPGPPYTLADLENALKRRPAC